MMKSFKDTFISCKSRLLCISEKEPLSKMSLIVIIALDIFVVNMIFAGLNDHTALLTSKFEYMPRVCRQAIIENSWIGERQTDKIQTLILAPGTSYRYDAIDQLDPEEVKKTHPACQKLLSSIRTVKEDKTILNIFRQRKIAQQNKAQLTRNFNESKAVYDTSLLENIAENSKESSITTISEISKELSQQINALSRDLASYNNSIIGNGSVAQFSQDLIEIQGKKIEIFRELKRYDFWYPIKELAWQFLFLLPLCGLFYLWNSISIKKESSLQVLISSHLLVVSFIPILFKILQLVLDVIPHRLLESVFDLLVSLKIIALWHYILIFLAILLTLVAIYVIQKKIFSWEKIVEKRLLKGGCYACGKKLPQHVESCPFCGTEQKKPCPHCKKKTYIAGKFCIHCGQNIVPE